MGLVVLLIIFMGLAVVIVWIADWASGARQYTALAALNRRLAAGEIDRAEYEEKRKLIGRQESPTGGLVRSAAVEKRELSKIDFEMIDDAFKALLRSDHPDPVTNEKIVDLRDKFRDAFTGMVGDRRSRLIPPALFRHLMADARGGDHDL